MNRMKRLAFVLVIVSNFVLCAKAQNPVGQFSLKPMAGVNISTFANAAVDMYHTKVGFTGGVEAEYGFTPWLGVSLGAMFSQQGAKYNATIGEYGVDEYGQKVVAMLDIKGKLKADYVNMPLLANFYVWKGLAIKTGLQVGFLVNDKMDGTVIMAGATVSDFDKITYEDISTPSSNYFLSSFGFEESDVCKSVVFGIPVGLSYEYKNITLDARYYFGLTRMDDAKEDPAARNRCLSITLGYKFKL